jgi:hypothetical protein
VPDLDPLPEEPIRRDGAARGGGPRVLVQEAEVFPRVASVETRAPTEEIDPRWVEAEIVFSPGSGPVTGAELLDAIAATNTLYVRAPSEDLERFRKERLEIPRDLVLHLGGVHGVIERAGYDVGLRPPVLRFRKSRGDREPMEPSDEKED